MEENKALITQKLFETLKVTRYGCDIEKMEYTTEGYDEIITVTFENGYTKRINVTADSGKSLISDVMYWIGK